MHQRTNGVGTLACSPPGSRCCRRPASVRPRRLDRDRLARRPQARPAGGELRPHRRAVGSRRPLLRGVLRRLRHGVGRPWSLSHRPSSQKHRGGGAAPEVRPAGRAAGESTLAPPALRPRSAGPNAAPRPGKPELVAGSQDSRVGHRPARSSHPHHTSLARQALPRRAAVVNRCTRATGSDPLGVGRDGRLPRRRSPRPGASRLVGDPRTSVPRVVVAVSFPTTKAICASDQSV